MRSLRARTLVRLLLWAAAAAPCCGQQADGPAGLVVELSAVQLVGAAAGAEQRWSAELLELWRARYGGWATLQAGPSAGRATEGNTAGDGQGGPSAGRATEGNTAGPLQARLRVEQARGSLHIRLSLQRPGGAVRSSQVAVWTGNAPAFGPEGWQAGPPAGVQAAAGELAWLLASSVGFPGPREPTPRLAVVVSLDSLELLRGGPKAPAEALGLTAGPGGVRLLLAERFLSLGSLLEVSPQTAADLLFAPRFPQGFVPAVLSANALGEPLVYDAGSGALLLYAAGEEGPARLETGIIRPIHAGGLAGGSLAALRGQGLLLVRRRGQLLETTEIPLGPGLAGAVSAERAGPLGVYDLGERRVRLLDAEGRETGSVKPLVDPQVLPLPQLFCALPEGGLLLGAGGELWCFSSDGLPRWRMRELGTTPRESLPGFFSVAPAEGFDRSVYLLDPLGRRLMKYITAAPTGSPAGADAASALERELAAGYERLAADAESRAELIGLCLREGLLLQAHYLFRLGGVGRQTASGLEERLLEKQAERLADLARTLEAELRLPEAEQAYNGALALLRELRGVDAVERRFPDAIRDLTEARNAAREILVAEPVFEAGPLSVAAAPAGAVEGAQELRLELRNRTARRLEDLTLDARLAVGPGSPAFLASHWAGSPGSVAPRGLHRLLLPLSGSGDSGAEDLPLKLHLLLSWRQGSLAGRQHLVLPVLLPGRVSPADAGEAGP